MGPLPGRASSVSHEKIVEAVINRKEVVLLPSKKIASKLHEVWHDIARDLGGSIKPVSLYTLVTCNRYNVRTELLKAAHLHDTDVHDVNIPMSLNTSNAHANALNESETTMLSDISAADERFREFVITIPKQEFDDLVIEKSYKRSNRNKTKIYRKHWKVLRSGKWQETITAKMWNTAHIKCGFNFQNHYLSPDGRSGYINGICNCGSKLRCVIDNSDRSAEYVIITCSIKEGTGKSCGKRYLRAPMRKEIAKELCIKPVDIYRAEKADEMMMPGDPDPPHLYSSSVLHVAKNQYISSKYADRDPTIALQVMKYSTYANAIHNIGLDPFNVHYWTNHQLHVYADYCATQTSCVYIDATGGILIRLSRPQRNKSKHIFLYQCVVNCEAGQFSVAQMLSESHDTNSIQYWLMMWTQSGAPHPREIVTDSSRALMNASVRRFTSFNSVEEYADGCKTSSIMPRCYIRIDVAHFLKTYASLLKGCTRLIRTFYLASIGQLILCRNTNDAANILTAILTVARSETEGNLQNGRATTCEIEKLKLKTIITGDSSECIDISPIEDITDDVEGRGDDADSSLHKKGNLWSSWGGKIDEAAQSASREIGDRENAHFLPRLADNLLKDIKLIPLWSCVCRDQFGYGRVPASSAPVEGEFNKIKNNLLKNCNTPMRPDQFLQRHVDYINGRIKIVDANSGNTETVTGDGGIETKVTSQKIRDAKAPSIQHDVIIVDEEMPMKHMDYNKCLVCANGDEPSGAHVCVICAKMVHALDGCSMSIDGIEEGHGQKRLCMTCSSGESAIDILASRDQENWRGLNVHNKKRTARYLGGNKTEVLDCLSWTKNRQLPILKNGSSMDLQSVRLGKKKITLINTCAFDSLFQLMLVAMCDYPLLCEKVELSNSNDLSDIAINTYNEGLRSHTYRLRAKLLSSVFVTDESFYSACPTVDCETNVGYLAGKLFHNTPSFEKVSICNEACPPRKKRLPVVSIQNSILRQPNFHDVIQNDVILRGTKKCGNKGCIGFEETTLDNIGDIVLLEVFDAKSDDPPMFLKNIPRSIKDPTADNEELSLIGIVDYKGETIRTRISGSSMGHYTAIALRRGSKDWVEYNDLSTKERKHKESHSCNPALLVYAKCKK